MYWKQVKNMKRKQIIAVLAVLAGVITIGIWQENENRENVSLTASHKEEKITGMKTDMKTDRTEMIMAAAGCSRKNAERIIRQLKELTDGEPVLAVGMEGADDHSILITDSSGKTYELGIDKKDFLYSVRDVEKGEYLLTVYE